MRIFLPEDEVDLYAASCLQDVDASELLNWLVQKKFTLNFCSMKSV